MTESGIDPDWDKADEWLSEQIKNGSVTYEQVIEVGKNLKEHMRAALISICEESGCSDEKLQRGLSEINEIDYLALAVKQACFVLRSAREEANP